MNIPKEFINKNPEMLGIFRYFAYDHLEEPMKGISKYFYDMAAYLIRTLPDNQQLFMGMSQLLQAKDCFLRASLDLPKYPTKEESRNNE